MRLAAGILALLSRGEPNCSAASGTGTAELRTLRLEARAHFQTGHPEQAQAPPPSDHVLAQLKAGETVYQTGELPETLRVSNIHCEPPKTVYETPFASIFPPSMENGDGTR